MTRERQIAERLKAAPEQPWYAEVETQQRFRADDTPRPMCVLVIGPADTTDELAKIGGLCAHAPSDLAYLLAEVKRLREADAKFRTDLFALAGRWRKEAHADAVSGVGHSLMKNDREYYGAVNAALVASQCADDLCAAIGTEVSK